jgi:hypothetical protein
MNSTKPGIRSLRREIIDGKINCTKVIGELANCGLKDSPSINPEIIARGFFQLLIRRHTLHEMDLFQTPTVE